MTASKIGRGEKGSVNITGVVEEETLGEGRGGRSLKRKSLAKASVENVLTVLKKTDVNPYQYDLHVNFPGGMPVDGPSAGVALATAIYSAIKGVPVDNETALTGEISIRGNVKPVGGVVAKVNAAMQAGARKVLIPQDNWQSIFKDIGIEVVPVTRIEQVLEHTAAATRESQRADRDTREAGRHHDCFTTCQIDVNGQSTAIKIKFTK